VGSAYRSDPVLRLIEPDELLPGFLALPDAEQCWRGRLYLAALWSTHHVPFAWWIALCADEDATHGYRALIEATPDALLVARTRALRAELALVTGRGLARA
jgi:hypothetical protein